MLILAKFVCYAAPTYLYILFILHLCSIINIALIAQRVRPRSIR